MSSSWSSKQLRPPLPPLPGPLPSQPITYPTWAKQYLSQLSRTIKQKNQIIEHLNQRIHNQEKQIDMLVLDAEEKHFHNITKYYVNGIQKYMRHGKYLLVSVDDDDAGDDGIYMSKAVRIVHFGELDLVQGKNMGYLHSNRENVGNIKENTTNVTLQPNDTKQINANPNKQANQLQQSCKGLSLQIQQLKEKLKAYTSMVTHKSGSKLERTDPKTQKSPDKNSISPKETPLFLNGSQSQKQQQQQPAVIVNSFGQEVSPAVEQAEVVVSPEKVVESGLNMQSHSQRNRVQPNELNSMQQREKKGVETSAFREELTPLKKKSKTRTIYIRK